jgi:hypothetical protein
MFLINAYIITTFFIAVMIYNLALVIYLGSKEHSPHSFALAIGFYATWVASSAMAYFFFSKGYNVEAAFFVRSCHFLAFLGSFLFLYFSLTYPDNYKPPVFIRNFFGMIIFFTALLFYAKDILIFFGASALLSEQTIIADVFPLPNGYLGWSFGSSITFY